MTNKEAVKHFDIYDLLSKMQDNFESSYPGCILDTIAGKTVICRKYPDDPDHGIGHCRNCIKIWLNEEYVNEV